MKNVNDGLDEFRSFLESADLHVTEQQQALIIHFGDQTSLELSLLNDPEYNQLYVQFLIPIGVEIPDQHFLRAAQAIADFNRMSPLGIFSISEESRPYFDYQYQVPAHGECMLNLLEAIQLSHLFAGRLLEYLQRKLREWVMPGLRTQLA